MANYDATPQTFTFAGRRLNGHTLALSTQRRRRYVVHEFAKRRGARVEDMDAGPRRLDARLVFLPTYDEKTKRTKTSAEQYREFAEAIDKNPYGLLVHPVTGRWQAFCEGPLEDVDYSRAVDAIYVRVGWIESELDAKNQRDIPDVAAAVQNVEVQRTAVQLAVAEFMGALAKGRAAQAKIRNAIDDALATLDVVTEPVDFVRDTIANIIGAQSAIMGAINGIVTRARLLNQDLVTLIDTTANSMTGGDITAGAANQLGTMVSAVQDTADDLKQKMIAASNTPAGASDAVAAVEEAQAASIDLSDAVASSRPVIVDYVVPEMMDVVTLAQRRYGTNPLARASDILGLNRIPNPAAIPSGTVLRIPAA